MLGRGVFRGIERLRYPDIVAPVWADAIQALALWPCVVAGAYLTFCTWRHSSATAAVVAVGVTSLLVGMIAGLAYVLGALLQPGATALRTWLDAAPPTGLPSWYSWLSVIVEFNVLYLSCLAVAIGSLSFRALMREHLTRLRAQSTAARNRLRLLRAQLNPHFLFNALTSIASLSEAEPRASQRLLVQLSDLLRRTLTASEREEHRLPEELAYIQAYLHIQESRLPGRLRWRVRTDPRCAAAQVPSLILLPLVENAVVHGPRGGSHRVEIDVEVTCPDGHLVMTVTNTCCRSVLPKSVHPGLGLRNVRDRLQMLYGPEAMLVTQLTTAGRFRAAVHLPTGSSDPDG